MKKSGGATDGLRAVAENVVTDYAEHCCDDLQGCACSMARLTRLLAAHPAPSPAVPVGALLASFEHEDWCCAKGCACHVRPCPGCTCLVDIVRRHIEALTATSEGWRSPAVPPAPTLAGLSTEERLAIEWAHYERGLSDAGGVHDVVERILAARATPPAPTLAGLAEVIGPVLDRHVGWQMHRAQMADNLAATVLAHLSPPGVPDRSDAGDVL